MRPAVRPAAPGQPAGGRGRLIPPRDDDGPRTLMGAGAVVRQVSGPGDEPPRGARHSRASAERSSLEAFLNETRGHMAPGPDVSLNRMTGPRVPGWGRKSSRPGRPGAIEVGAFLMLDVSVVPRLAGQRGRTARASVTARRGSAEGLLTTVRSSSRPRRTMVVEPPPSRDAATGAPRSVSRRPSSARVVPMLASWRPSTVTSHSRRPSADSPTAVRGARSVACRPGRGRPARASGRAPTATRSGGASTASKR